MPTKIDTPVGEATCVGFRWKSENKDFEKWLNEYTENHYPYGMGGEVPDKDYEITMEVISEMPEAKLVAHKPVKSEPGRIY